MSNKDSSLKRILGQLQKGAGLAPPTLDEAEALMAGAEETAIEDSRLLGIADAVVSGMPLDCPKEPFDLWFEADATSMNDCEQLVLNRNKGDLDSESKKTIRNAEKKALGKTRTKLDWLARQTRLDRACQAAEEIVMGQVAPIDPLAVAVSEGRNLLRIQGEDFGDAFDGQLKYHHSHQCFLMLYNTKYDGSVQDSHHPRTRFSIGHELGHYFLDKHRAFLMGGGEPHQSRSEFKNDDIVEQEADAFAAGLLMPSELARPLVNEDNLSIPLIQELASVFNLSLVSTSLKAVQLSDFPCAVVGIRQGLVCWCFCSKPLIDTGFYPPEKRAPKSNSALAASSAFDAGDGVAESGSSYTKHWFRTYDRNDLENLHVDEHYLPVRSMGILIVLLTIPEDELDFKVGE